MIDRYKIILFDWDGTLVDTCDVILECHNHVRGAMGFAPWSKEDLFERNGTSQSTRELYPEIYGDKTEEAIAMLNAYVDKVHLDYVRVMSGAQQLLDYIRTLTIPMGLVSNKRHAALVKEVEYLKWDHYFLSIVGAGRADKDKPSATPLKFAADAIDPSIDPSEIIYIGDSETDLKSAQNFGCSRALIDWGKDKTPLVEQYAPCHALSSLDDLIEKPQKKAC